MWVSNFKMRFSKIPCKDILKKDLWNNLIRKDVLTFLDLKCQVIHGLNTELLHYQGTRSEWIDEEWYNLIKVE